MDNSALLTMARTGREASAVRVNVTAIYEQLKAQEVLNQAVREALNPATWNGNATPTREQVVAAVLAAGSEGYEGNLGSYKAAQGNMRANILQGSDAVTAATQEFLAGTASETKPIVMADLDSNPTVRTVALVREGQEIYLEQRSNAAVGIGKKDGTHDTPVSVSLGGWGKQNENYAKDIYWLDVPSRTVPVIEGGAIGGDTLSGPNGLHEWLLPWEGTAEKPDVSHGCVRMKPKDTDFLQDTITSGTLVVVAKTLPDALFVQNSVQKQAAVMEAEESDVVSFTENLTSENLTSVVAPEPEIEPAFFAEEKIQEIATSFEDYDVSPEEFSTDFSASTYAYTPPSIDTDGWLESGADGNFMASADIGTMDAVLAA
jgi:lipoprotein-anchoring transpeptidase ErfK/SrfK